jgi:nucleotide-binding universal stress UspA family protein
MTVRMRTMDAERRCDMNWKTIVVGIDDTDASNRALERAADLAQASGAKLLVTSVAPVLTGMAAAHGVGPWAPAEPPEGHRDELRHAREFLVGRHVPAEFVLGVGEPSEAILDLAEKHAADLIVVGTREPGIVERLLGGSVSRSVSHHAHCDVLIVH